MITAIVFLLSVSAVSAANDTTMATNHNSTIAESHNVYTNIENKNIAKDSSNITKTIQTKKSVKEEQNTATKKDSSKMVVSNKTVKHNEKVQLITTVINNNTGNYVNGGNVAFKINGKTIGHTTVVNGKACYTYDTLNLTPKTYIVTAIYGGTNTVNDTRANGYLTIIKEPSKMSVSNKTVVYGQNVRLVSTVVNKDIGNYINGGNVAFKVNSKTIGHTTLVNGKAYYTYNTSNLRPKTYTITVTYGGTNTVNDTRANGYLTIIKHDSKMELSHEIVKNNLKIIATVTDIYTNKYVNNGNIAFKINGKTIGHTTIKNGKASINYKTKLSPQKYTISASYGGTSNINGVRSSSNINLKYGTNTSLNNITSTSYSNVRLVATVTDKTNGKYVSKGNVLFKINGKTLGFANISKGKAYYTYNTSGLTAKTYNITAIYGETNQYSSSRNNATLKITKLNTKITLPTITTTTGTKTTIKVTVRDSNKNLVKYGKVAFKINGKTLKTAHIINGSFTLKYTPVNTVKNYTMTAVFGSNNRYASSIASNKLIVKLKVNVLNWNSTGNIIKNKVLYSNLVKSDITNNLIKAATKGTPYVKLGNSNKTTVFIIAGIQGSELSSQAAAVKLINTLSTHNLNGTVYIMPFVAPSMTAENSRTYNGVSLNTIANVNDTISNKIYQFAKSTNATALGDFHCTMPGGKPGRDTVTGTYKPMASSANLTKYIAKECNVSKVIYNKAGAEYPGALEDYCNNHGITSITGEAKSAHGTIAKGSVDVSYAMMESFLRYYKIIT